MANFPWDKKAKSAEEMKKVEEVKPGPEPEPPPPKAKGRRGALEPEPEASTEEPGLEE